MAKLIARSRKSKLYGLVIDQEELDYIYQCTNVVNPPERGTTSSRVDWRLWNAVSNHHSPNREDLPIESVIVTLKT